MRGGKDLRGLRFGHWTAIERIGKNERQHALWRCRCDCGAEAVKTAGELGRNRKHSACPDCRKKISGDLSRKHGETGTELHGTWLAMRKRCLDFNAWNFKNYGGRGIKIHGPWCDDYSAFRDYVLATIGDHPGHGFSLDRIDNNGHYEPGNIRWADRKTQMVNRRKPKAGWTWSKNRIAAPPSHDADASGLI